MVRKTACRSSPSCLIQVTEKALSAELDKQRKRVAAVHARLAGQAGTCLNGITASRQSMSVFIQHCILPRVTYSAEVRLSLAQHLSPLLHHSKREQTFLEIPYDKKEVACVLDLSAMHACIVTQPKTVRVLLIRYSHCHVVAHSKSAHVGRRMRTFVQSSCNCCTVLATSTSRPLCSMTWCAQGYALASGMHVAAHAVLL